MRRFAAVLLGALAVGALAPSVHAQDFIFKGKKRKYVLKGRPRGKRVGVVIGLHCNGGTPASILARWERIVTRDNCVMAAPESIAGSTNPWRDPENDGFEFVKAVVEDVAKKYPVDRTRIYLVGYSAGACHACRIGIPNSDFFTGVIAYAGSSGQGFGDRKIPVALIHGTADRAVKYSSTEQLANMLKEQGWPLYFKPIQGGGHEYNPKYDAEAWAFLRKNPVDPPPEMVAEESLQKARAAVRRRKYADAYAALRKGLETGKKKEELQAELDGLLESGGKAVEKAGEKRGRSRELALKKVAREWKGTPIEEKAKAALEEK